jgi:hypothetical protein
MECSRHSIDGILGTNGEITINNNGHKLEEFASVNELKITNTFFRQKEIHKMTWSARDHRSIIDYILTYKKLSPLVNDTKVIRGYDVFTVTNLQLTEGTHLIQRDVNIITHISRLFSYCLLYGEDRCPSSIK